MKIKLIILSFLIIAFSLNSCIVVKYFSKEEKVAIKKVAPKPEIPMSDIMVRSEEGDMIAFLPKGWFFIDLENQMPPDVFLVATNADYNISLVFSKIRKNKQLIDSYEKDKELGIAKYSYQRKTQKTSGRLQLSKKYELLEAGNLNFGIYESSYTGGAVSSKTAVFKSELENFYEFALVPMDILGKPLPSEKDLNSIFNSVIATIKF